VSVRVRKIRRRRLEGEIAVEQTRDLALTSAIAEKCGGVPVNLSPADCYLVAYSGDEPVGVVGVETVVDTGLIRLLIVTEGMRRRGIGAALLGAARKAAHTRGARRLFAIAPDETYLSRFGFERIEMGELREAMWGTSAADGLASSVSSDFAQCEAFCLDISADGVIVR
jgi:N-acetylglutamate synthase-like GNAT family acetyltransferase